MSHLSEMQYLQHIRDMDGLVSMFRKAREVEVVFRDRRGLDSGSNHRTQEDAILVAAEAELTLLGVRQSSVDEMARKAGVSRSTLYRRFHDKQNLVVAVVNKIADDAATELQVAVSNCDSPGQTVVEAFCAAVHVLNTRTILRRVFRGSEAVLPHELVRFLERKIIDLLGSQFAALLKESGSTKPDEELLIISELLMKIGVSYLEGDSRFVSFDDPVAVRDFANKYLAALVSDG